MKKLNVMLHTEIIECLKELDNENLAKVMRMIFDWYDEKPVEPETQLEKFSWKFILPRLERNKEDYLNTVERNKENGKKGGAPIGNKNALKNKTSEGLIETTENNPKQHNLNLNNNLNNNSSKEELLSRGFDQPTSSEDDSVVSKGLERLESIFPIKKNSIDIDTINLWNSLTQQEKQTLIQRATVYIRDEKKNEDGKYIKQLTKWLKEQKDKGIEPKSSKMFNSTNNDDPRLLKLTDGNIYSFILSKVSTTSAADKIYQQFNKKELFSTKEEMFKGIFDYFNNKN
jgi:hypothetical protein